MKLGVEVEVCSVRLLQMDFEVTKDYKWTATRTAAHTARGAATYSGPPGQHIHLGPPAFPVWPGIPRDIPLGRNRDCVPEPVFFPLLPNQIILFQLLKLFSFVCKGKVIIFSFVFL